MPTFEVIEVQEVRSLRRYRWDVTAFDDAAAIRAAREGRPEARLDSGDSEQIGDDEFGRSAYTVFDGKHEDYPDAIDRAVTEWEAAPRPVDLLAELVARVQALVNLNDSDHPEFLDSCADVCQELAQMGPLLEKARAAIAAERGAY